MIVNDEEVKKYKLQAVVRKKQLKLIKQKLEDQFHFKIENYLIDDILENETYLHFCSLVGLAVANNKLNTDDGETLKEGIKELFEITSGYDRLDKTTLIDTSDDDRLYDDYYIKEFIDVNKYLDREDKITLKKLSIPLKNKILTNFEFDSIRADVAEYYFDEDENIKGMDLSYCRPLRNTGVSREVYNKLVRKFDDISNKYGIF